MVGKAIKAEPAQKVQGKKPTHGQPWNVEFWVPKEGWNMLEYVEVCKIALSFG